MFACDLWLYNSRGRNPFWSSCGPGESIHIDISNEVCQGCAAHFRPWMSLYMERLESFVLDRTGCYLARTLLHNRREYLLDMVNPERDYWIHYWPPKVIRYPIKLLSNESTPIFAALQVLTLPHCISWRGWPKAKESCPKSNWSAAVSRSTWWN